MEEFYVSFTVTSLVGPDYSDTEENPVEDVILSAPDLEAAEKLADGLKEAVLFRHPSLEEEAALDATADDIIHAEVMPLAKFLENLRNSGLELLYEATTSGE